MCANRLNWLADRAGGRDKLRVGKGGYSRNRGFLGGGTSIKPSETVVIAGLLSGWIYRIY
jgi:hypothetical protein